MFDMFDDLFGAQFVHLGELNVLLELEALKRRDPASFTAQVVRRAMEAAQRGGYEANFWRRYLRRLTK